MEPRATHLLHILQGLHLLEKLEPLLCLGPLYPLLLMQLRHVRHALSVRPRVLRLFRMMGRLLLLGVLLLISLPVFLFRLFVPMSTA
jgi:hypothetical protein